MQLALQTSFPFENDVHCTVTIAAPAQSNLRIRIPSWASGEMKMSVNGETSGMGKPGTYLAIDRQWTDGDTIEFTLPASIRVRPYNGDDRIAGKIRYSVEYGPILLAAVGSSKVELLVDKGHKAEDLANHLEPVASSPLHFTVGGNRGQKFMPYWQISEEEFTCYPVVTAIA
jgi:uncharacterized protein